jgi:CHAT domain-containing protein/cytochrome c-type biogenesis protein CcmH/NrfG
LKQPQDRHLDDTGIDAFVSSRDLGLNPEKSADPALKRVRQHIEVCQPCKRKVLTHLAVQKEISQLGPVKGVLPGPDCKIETNWIEVVAGLLSKSKTAELMKHAAQCGYCGPRLKKAAGTLFEEATPEEMEILSSLNSGRPEWPKEMVEKLRGDRAPVPVSGWRSYFHWPKLAFAAAMSAAVALASWLTVVMLRPLPVEQLLAQAYTQKRTLELRIPGAKYSEFRIERGLGKSSSDKASSLVKAESLIREHLDKTPNDPQWLQAQGRADLLEDAPGSAIRYFEKARESDPNSPSLMVDLASALYFRDDGPDRGKAYEWLSQALVKAPDDPIALFNRAIVAESINMPEQAKADWEHFLRVESSGPWADEAEVRRKKVQEKLENQRKGRSQLLLAPSELEAQSGSPQAQQLVDARIEEYLHQAIRDWLPRAYPAADIGQPADTKIRGALAVLSRITSSNHADEWLQDLLAKSQEQNFSGAVKALSAALAANDRGDYREARSQSELAEWMFTEQNNHAGILQARFQRLFALQFMHLGTLCASQAETAAPDVLQTHYTWLQAQILLQEFSCLSINADIGQARSKVDQALNIAQTSKYKELLLRCINFSAGSAGQVGDMKANWIHVTEGLNKFWAGNYSALRGYNLYTSLALAAERASCPHLQVAAWTQAISLIGSDPDLLQRGMAHFYLAQAAWEAQLLETSEHEYQESVHLLRLAPASTARDADLAEVQLAKAKLEIKYGSLRQAYDRLRELSDTVRHSDDAYRAADFYATLGQVELQLGENAEAGRHLRSGLLVTEHILGTLSAEKEKIEWERKASPVYHALVEERLWEGDVNGALEVWEWYLGATIRKPDKSAVFLPAKRLFSRVSSEDAPVLTPTEVSRYQSRLTRQTVLSYALVADGLAIWAFDNRGIFYAYVRRDPREIEQIARHFLELCADPDSNLEIVHQYGQELYNLLIAPIAVRLEPSRGLIIEAEGALSLVPFEALMDPAFHYLGTERTIVSSLGLYYAARLRPLRPIMPSDVGLMVAVASPKGFGLLPDLDPEIKAVAGRFSRPIILNQKEDATLPAVLRALPSAAVFYFAGHAVATPERTGLVMADLNSKTGDSRLLTADLLEPKLLTHLQVAVLAACNTNKGNEGNYSDTTSLVRTMVRAGVPSVVASRWGLISGAPDRLALPFVFPKKLSQTSGHPYYWASLNQFGGLDVIPQ